MLFGFNKVTLKYKGQKGTTQEPTLNPVVFKFDAGRFPEGLSPHP